MSEELSCNKSEFLTNLRRGQKKSLRKLESLAKEVDFYTKDVHVRKEESKRLIKKMVSEQQQAILARGKQIAKDVNQTYEEKLTALNDIKGYITCASNEVIANLTILDGATNDDELKDLQDARKIKEIEDHYTLPSIDLPVINSSIVFNAIENVRVENVAEFEELVDFPNSVYEEGMELDMMCSDLWLIGRKCFALFPARPALLRALERLSSKIRKQFVEDRDWHPFGSTEVQPRENEEVYVRHSATKLWARGKIVSNNVEQKKSTVFLMDWGVQLSGISWDDILPATRKFTEANPLTLQCVIDETVEPGTGRDAKWFFNDTVQAFSAHQSTLRVKLVKQLEPMDIPEMPVWKVEISGTLKGIEICLSEEVNKKLARARNAAGGAMMSRDIRTEFQSTAQSFNAATEQTVEADQNLAAECAAVEACAGQVEPVVAVEAECPVVVEEAEGVKKVQPDGDGIAEKDEANEKEGGDEKEKHADDDQVSLAESDTTIPLNMQQSQQYRDELCADASEAELTVKASSDTEVESECRTEAGVVSASEQPSVRETEAEEKSESVAEYNGDLGTAV